MEENNKKKSKLQDESDQIEQSINDLVNDEDIFLDATDPDVVDEALPALQEKVKETSMDAYSKAEVKARKTIENLLDFYLDAHIIENEEYIKSKREINVMGLRSLLFQMQTGEKALMKLVDTIEDGNIAPRMFEVLATLQKSLLDIVKAQTTMMITVEEEAKKIRYDHEIYRGIANGSDDDDEDTKKLDTSDGVKTRGAKDLMMQLEMEDDDFEEIDEEVEESEEENNEAESES